MKLEFPPRHPPALISTTLRSSRRQGMSDEPKPILILIFVLWPELWFSPRERLSGQAAF
jgi:hypothetical protein